MPQTITMDSSGRLVIPKNVRMSLRLVAGSRLTLVADDERLVLVPEPSQPRLVERNGLLVVAGGEQDAIPDHRTLREERLVVLGPAG